MRSTIALILAALSPLAVACSSSSSPEEGTDADTKKDSSTSVDAGHDHDASKDATTPVDAAADTGSVDAGEDVAPQPVFTMDAGTTWTDLYRDYFGNDTAVHTAGCSNGSFCHAAMSDNGYQSSGFLCPPGDKTTCYTSMTSQATSGPYLITADAGYDADDLSTTLCTVNDAGQPTGGEMPYDCVYNFTPVDVARIRAWIAAGYPDN